MNKSDYLDAASKWEIVDERVRTVGKAYSGRIPELLQRIVSHSDEPHFFDDGSHVLSLAEMLGTEETLGISFSDKHLVPVVDCCDGDYIVYDYDKEVWAIYNMIDEVVFRQGDSLIELLG